MQRYRPFLAALFALITPAAATSAQTRVPMDVSGEWLVVPVILGQRDTLRFILDTGAMRSVVSQRAARRLGLQHTRSLSIEGASGAAVVPGSTLRTFEFAGRTVPELDVIVLPDEILTPSNTPERGPFDGVLGADVLAWFDVLISAPDAELVAFPPGTGARLAGDDLAPPSGSMVAVHSSSTKSTSRVRHSPPFSIPAHGTSCSMARPETCQVSV